MTEEQIWMLLEQTKKESDGDGERQLELLEADLATRSVEDMVDFQKFWQLKMTISYGRDLWGAAYMMHNGCSDDGFEYFRSWLISRGKKTFEEALSEPDTLAKLGRLEDEEVELEHLANVASNAYQAKTGLDDSEFYSQLGNLNYPDLDMNVDFDDDSYMKKRYPKLWGLYLGGEDEQEEE